jgi:uncharacterized protein YecE (DUF72 family)
MVAWEPRHASWKAPEASRLLEGHGVTPVLTDIPGPDSTHSPAGAYVRLHGTPRRYYSAYSEADLRSLATWLREAPAHDDQSTIVIFDNTASSAGVRNALELSDLLD